MPRTRLRPRRNAAMAGSSGGRRDRRLSSPGKLRARLPSGRGRNGRVNPYAASTSRASLQVVAAPLWFPCAAGWFPARLLQAEPYVDRPGSDARIPLAQRRTLMELDRSTCRWPVGDPADTGFFLCGGRVASGRPYCRKHCARAYRGPAISAARNN